VSTANDVTKPTGGAVNYSAELSRNRDLPVLRADGPWFAVVNCRNDFCDQLLDQLFS
jgi:hypothetical protein